MPDDLTPLWISLKTASVATVLATCLGILAAGWMLSYRGRARGLIDGVLTLPLVLPPTVVGFLLLLLLGKNSPIGQALNYLGVSPIFTWTAAVMAATVVAFPLVYKTVLSALEQLDSTLISSARTLGASDWRIFWQILLPLVWPGILAGMILAFARALGEFGATLMVGGSISGVTQTIPIAIFFAAEAGRMGVALAWVVLMVLISLVVITGIHQGSRNALPRTVLPQAGAQRLFNWIYFGTLKVNQFGLIPAVLTQQRRRLGHPSAQTTRALARSRSPNGRGRVPVDTAAREPGLPQLAVEAFPAPQTMTTPSSNSPTQPQAAELVVQIERQVPGFDLDLQFRTDQQPLGLLGASGSGKTMTLRCIAGLDTPSQGRIVLNGRVLFDSHKRINLPSCDRNVGIVFQNYALFPHLTVAQNIAFGMAAIPKPQRAADVVQYLDMMDLSGLGDRYPHQLSGGQQQRVALARALAIQPDMLLLDEPLSALDTYLRSHVEKLLVEVLSEYRGITLFITHKLEEAYRICTNLLVLANGRILANGTKEAIFQRPPSIEVAKVSECKNFSRARRVDDTHIEAIDWTCQLAVQAPIPADLAYVGLRAHHIQFVFPGEQPNTFPSWLAILTETQHRVTLYLKLHGQPSGPHDYHLQAEVYREKWDRLRHSPFPWYICLDPARLIVMPE
ncbi:molybdenum ABC transporter permease subunit [Halomicronema hongdechloris C2206]|uniref:Molybdenum ABC transporter permease subunit n=1 Tax=Halomicronema hongdechloris C2206 TaxID=1641165 RepID=A0A1Z3HLL3_9CYAN|nr:molybdate ABC transporter permease subunit [Halomicronema hongdechloris]ASC71175.1 molybdenum ABC transporter permease subunit [Halomicronema hongdechloris C2206]